MFLVVSKIAWLLLDPVFVVLAAAVAAGVLLRTGWRRAGRTIAAGVAIVALAFLALPLDVWLLSPLEERFPPVRQPPASVDGIVVLSGGLDGEGSDGRRMPELTSAGDREVAFVALARRYPHAKLVYTGGGNGILDLSSGGAAWIRPLVESLGIDPARVLVDPAARNTHENAVNAMRLAAPAPGSRWLMVTSAFHIPRAVGCFRRIGWDVTPYPVDHMLPGRDPRWFTLPPEQRLVRLAIAAREWVGLLAYRLEGFTDEFFPRPDGAATAPRVAGTG